MDAGAVAAGRSRYVRARTPTSRDERIQVRLLEVDEVDRVLLLPDAANEFWRNPFNPVQ